MDAVLAPYTPEESIAAYKQIRFHKNPKKNRASFASRHAENFDIHGGILHHPPLSMSSSYPLTASVFYGQNYQQPPLLPLPTSAVHRPLLNRSYSQGTSYLPPGRKNRTRELSLTPKKSKPTKKDDAKRDSKMASQIQSLSEFLTVASENRLGPDPNDLPKHLSVVLSSSPSTVAVENIDTFSGSVFSLAPPPSSLPLPKFSLRSKLGCNAKAAGIDTGAATDNLRRLLRLR